MVVSEIIVFEDLNLFLFFFFGILDFMYVVFGIFVIVIGFLMLFFMLLYLYFNKLDNLYFIVVVFIKDFLIGNWGCVFDE